MKLNRATYDPGELLEFYEEGLTALGALCERTWHDRLDVVADGHAATLWSSTEALHEVELYFAPADAASARDAEREIFPGCPLTFQLAEALWAQPLNLERFVLPDPAPPRPPDAAVVEKLWRNQFADSRRWHLAAPFQPDFHFTLLALARCEIQAIDQHWSLHRLAISLPGGELDDDLAHKIGFHQAGTEPAAQINWPAPDPPEWSKLLRSALADELATELALVRARQDNSLRRELARIDDYFQDYERELNARAAHSSRESSKSKTSLRLAAAKAEHARRRTDQAARHEIRIQPHLNALLLVAESAWRARLDIEQSHRALTVDARFIPRSRRWMVVPSTSPS